MMKTPLALGVGSLLLLTAFSVSARPATVSPAFTAEIVGEVWARPTGSARFGRTGGNEGVPAVFTISLGAEGADGSILFTRRSGEPLSPGSYRISDRADGTDDLRALVMTGSATRPTGVFQARSGLVRITSATEQELRGTFHLEASGFLASEPDREGRPVSVSGSFVATR